MSCDSSLGAAPPRCSPPPARSQSGAGVVGATKAAESGRLLGPTTQGAALAGGFERGVGRTAAKSGRRLSSRVLAAGGGFRSAASSSGGGTAAATRGTMSRIRASSGAVGGGVCAGGLGVPLCSRYGVRITSSATRLPDFACASASPGVASAGIAIPLRASGRTRAIAATASAPCACSGATAASSCDACGEGWMGIAVWWPEGWCASGGWYASGRESGCRVTGGSRGAQRGDSKDDRRARLADLRGHCLDVRLLLLGLQLLHASHAIRLSHGPCPWCLASRAEASQTDLGPSYSILLDLRRISAHTLPDLFPISA